LGNDLPGDVRTPATAGFRHSAIIRVCFPLLKKDALDGPGGRVLAQASPLEVQARTACAGIGSRSVCLPLLLYSSPSLGETG